MDSQTLQARQNMKIVLKSNQQNLDEVMVVAYGTAKKSAYTGAASEIKADKIENRLTSNVSQVLTGTMAGVQSYQTNGQPERAYNSHTWYQLYQRCDITAVCRRWCALRR